MENIEKEVINCVNDLVKKVIKKEYNTQYWIKNCEKLKIINNERRKTYNKGKPPLKEGRDKRRESDRKYSNSPGGKKKRTYSQWKSRGLNMETFEEVYDKYLHTTHCELCNVELEDKNNRNQKCMDHCHTTGQFRNIVCRNCNMNVIKLKRILI